MSWKVNFGSDGIEVSMSGTSVMAVGNGAGDFMNHCVDCGIDTSNTSDSEIEQAVQSWPLGFMEVSAKVEVKSSSKLMDKITGGKKE